MAVRSNQPALLDPQAEPSLTQREEELLHEIDEHREKLRARLDELNRRAHSEQDSLRRAAMMALLLGGGALALGLVWRGVLRARRR